MQWEEFRFSVRHLSETDQETVRRAYELGERMHENQKRKSGEPYFTHPIAVTRVLAELGADCDTIAAGLLHDAVEDTPLTLSDVEHEFGPVVAMLIDGVTKLDGVDVVEKPGLDTQIETLRKMFTLMQQDVRIMVIKLADRLHNMQTIGFRSPESQKRIARETLDVYVKIADRLCMRDMQTALEALCLEVLEPESYAEMRALRTEREAKGEAVVATVVATLAKKHNDVSRDVSVLHEQKSWYKLQEQLRSKSDCATGIATIAVAIVCPDVDHCYRVLGALHAEWQREILSFQDFINSPMINGYQGVHTTIILEDGTRVRCKIRTHDMDEYAHRGITTRCFDDRALGLSDYLPWTQRIAAIADDTSDRSDEFWDGLQSDILGSTITVHGPDDRTAMLPANATALDAAFYLFGDLALCTRHLFMNGHDALFDEDLRNAATVTGEFGQHATANVQWLHLVKTATALAIIRKHLNAAPTTDKRTLGKEMLDVAMQRSLHVHVDEVSPSLLEDRVRHRGIDGLHSLFEAVANGKLDPTDIANDLLADFDPHAARRERRRSWIVRARIDTSAADSVLKTLRHFDAERISMSQSNGKTSVIARLNLDRDALSLLEHALASDMDHGEWSLRGARASKLILVATCVLLALWGLDPVMARFLLASISPLDLTVIRATTFFGASAVLFCTQFLRRRGTLKHLSPRNPVLILSGVTLFATALLSYLALATVPATSYILCIVWAVFSMIAIRKRRENAQWHHFAMAGCIAGIGALVVALSSGANLWTVLAGIGAGIGFVAYSESSSHYQRASESIQLRYPAFLFWMSCVGLLLAGALLPFSTISSVPAASIAVAAAFVIAFSVLPYSLYFEVTRRTDASVLDPLLPLAALVTLLGELPGASPAIAAIGAASVGLFLTYFYATRAITNGTARL